MAHLKTTALVSLLAALLTLAAESAPTRDEPGYHLSLWSLQARSKYDKGLQDIFYRPQQEAANNSQYALVAVNAEAGLALAAHYAIHQRALMAAKRALESIDLPASRALDERLEAAIYARALARSYDAGRAVLDAHLLNLYAFRRVKYLEQACNAHRILATWPTPPYNNTGWPEPDAADSQLIDTALDGAITAEPIDEDALLDLILFGDQSSVIDLRRAARDGREMVPLVNDQPGRSLESLVEERARKCAELERSRKTRPTRETGEPDRKRTKRITDM